MRDGPLSELDTAQYGARLGEPLMNDAETHTNLERATTSGCIKVGERRD
jgi:hypothetical protein